jgi:hypothetical protein
MSSVVSVDNFTTAKLLTLKASGACLGLFKLLSYSTN